MHQYKHYIMNYYEMMSEHVHENFYCVLFNFGKENACNMVFILDNCSEHAAQV